MKQWMGIMLGILSGIFVMPSGRVLPYVILLWSHLHMAEREILRDLESRL